MIFEFFTASALCSVRSYLVERPAPLFFRQHSRLRNFVEIAVGEFEGSECHPSSDLVLLKKKEGGLGASS